MSIQEEDHCSKQSSTGGQMNISSIDTLSLSDEQVSELKRIAAAIEPLCELDVDSEERREFRTQACATLSVSERTIRSLVSKYSSKGILGLLRKQRKDAGFFRSFDPALIAKSAKLLQENPHRSMARVLEFLRNDPIHGDAAKKISESTLYHRLSEAGINFRELRSALPKRAYVSFQADHANQLWQGDARHGIEIPHPKQPGKNKRTFLFAWIDDYSRFILHAEYYFDEKLPRLENCFRQAVLKYGLPDKLYVDNGAAYVAHQFLFVLDAVQVKKIHHPPYCAWCKGKVEALMKAFKKFQSEAELVGMKTLEELNSALAAWVDVEHNRKIHSQTGETPLARFMAGLERRPPRMISDLEKFNNSFLSRVKRIVDPYGQINFQTNVYLASEIAPGTPLLLRYNPFDLRRLYLFDSKNEICLRTLTARTISRSQMKNIPEEKKIPAGKTSRASLEYFVRLREQNLKNISDNIGNTTFTNLKNQN